MNALESTPPENTLERWAWDYLRTDSLAAKFVLEAPPRASEPNAPLRRAVRPSRPAPMIVSEHAPKSPGPDAMRVPARRAQLIHTFLHHELQAAELMCWAILAFPEAPEAFRTGLANIARDEVRHMVLYRDHLATLGSAFGDHPVRDWFWQRVPNCETPAHFAATMGMGFEGANLDHTLRFAERFRAIGDETGARIQEQVHEEELPHVRFGVHWFTRLTGGIEFATWRAHLAPPLSPWVMRGTPVEHAARARAGMSDAFVAELGRWTDPSRG